MLFYVLCCIIFLFFLRNCLCLDYLEGWNYINLHCRDNDNKPVDWWYIYSPASDQLPYLERGRNFTYITSDNAGRWQSSSRQLSDSAMLRSTLSPMYRTTYLDYLAFATYEEREADPTSQGSSALGILMADELGGLWIGHTIPGFPDLLDDRMKLPNDEIGKSHLLTCMSVDLITINEIAMSLRETAPQFTFIRIPPRVKRVLPDWSYLDQPVSRSEMSTPSSLNFLSRHGSMRAVLLVRRPGEQHCLYHVFARSKGVVLDVYGHGIRPIPLCQKNYSIRGIDKISLKLKESVHYIRSSTDRARFAVSTAAHWQRRGSSPAQYWVCTSNLDEGDRTGRGGVMVCVDSYEVWLTFDNFKVKEPQC